MLTAFMTSNLFIVLPMLVEHSQALMRRHGLTREQDTALPEVVVPASFNFPHVGKLLSLSFVLFAGWFADAAVPVGGYLRLASTGLVVLFGNINAAMPFLLDLFRIPADTFQLFLATSVVNATLRHADGRHAHDGDGARRVVGDCRTAGNQCRPDRPLSGRLAGADDRDGCRRLALLCGAAVSPSVRPRSDADGHAAPDGPRRREDGARACRADTPSSTIDRVRSSGVLRACWLPDALPFAFVNSRQELVGFDVEMMQDLAAELNATAEFVQIPRGGFGHRPRRGAPATS